MGYYLSKEQKDKSTTKNSSKINEIISVCIKRTDTLKLTPTTQSLKFKHFLTFPDSYEGLKLWEGAIILLRNMLLSSPEKFHKKKVMDLGGGMGIVGIAMAKFFESEVTISDYIPQVLNLAEVNVEMNAPYESKRPTVLNLDWNNCEEFNEQYDIVVGCELVYAITNCDNLIKLLVRILKKGSILVMIIPTCRTNRKEFLERVEEIGEFEVKEEILKGDYYTSNPLVGETKDIFYPLKELEFSMLEIKFK